MNGIRKGKNGIILLVIQKRTEEEDEKIQSQEKDPKHLFFFFFLRESSFFVITDCHLFSDRSSLFISLPTLSLSATTVYLSTFSIMDLNLISMVGIRRRKRKQKKVLILQERKKGKSDGVQEESKKKKKKKKHSFAQGEAIISIFFLPRAPSSSFISSILH